MEEPEEEMEPAEEMEEEAMGVDPSGQTIQFWHVWGSGEANVAMTAIVEEFNATNEWGITVEALDQGRYNDLEDAMNAAIQSGDLPSMLVGYTNALANWYQVDTLVNLDEFVNDPDWGLDEAAKEDFYEGAFEGGVTPEGARIGYPISQSANVIFYNSGWAQELGFDSAPATPEEFMEQACAATEANSTDDNPDNDGTGGLVLYAGASNVASWTFAFGGDFLGDQDAVYDFTSPEVEAVANFLKDMWDEGCAFPTESYPNPEFATRKALYTMSSTAGIPFQVEAFNAEDAIRDEWQIIPFPGPDGNQAVDAFGQYIAIVDTTPEQNLATWLFFKYLTSPETQEEWVRASAYYPTRRSTVDLLGDYSSENDYWAQGLELVEYGKAEPSLPSWTTVRREVQDTFEQILASDPEQIPTLLEELNAAAAEAVEETQ
ncbi:MAG: extracellular solute-binding protein, partial [Anaerolineales bacterium]